MVFAIGKQVLENMYLKYITGAKKIKIKNKKNKKRIYTSAFESAGIGPFKLY